MEGPHPLNERQSHEAELAQLRDRITVYRGELTGEPAPDEMRQEWLDWQIRRAKNRIALVESWLRAEPL